MHKTILKNISWLSFQDLTFHILGMIFYIILARKLGETGLGIYSYVFSLMTFLSFFLDFGISTHYWRKWCTNTKDISQDISTILSAKFALLLPISIGLFVYAILRDQSYLVYLLLAYGIYVLDIFRQIPLYYFNAKNMFNKVVGINAVDRVISLIGGSILLLMGKDLLFILILFLIARLFSLLLSLRLFDVTLKLKLKKSSVLYGIGLGSSLFFIQILNNLYFKVDTLLIRHMIGIDAVGLYNASYRIIESLTIIPTIIFFGILSPIIALQEKGKKDVINNVMNVVLKYLGIVSLFISIFFTFYSEEILDFLYGSQFIGSGVTLIILGWTIFFLFIGTPLSTYVFAKREDRKLITRLFILTIINICLNILLIPMFGINGSAIATLITEIVSLFMLFAISGITLTIGWMIKLLGVSTIFIVVLMYVHFPLFPTLILCGVIYLLLLKILNVIDFKDIRTTSGQSIV